MKTSFQQKFKTPHLATRFEKLHKCRGLIAGSFYDSTISQLKKRKKPPYRELDILEAINRKTGEKFQSLSELSQHVETMIPKKLLTD